MAIDDQASALLDLRLAQVAARHRRAEGRRQLWLAHHWPEHYEQRCVRVGRRHLCRRCTALYPLGFLVAGLAAAGYAPWPSSLDPGMIWLLSIPATVAYVGEAIGLFGYSARWQVATMLVAAIGFGRALGYELLDRWSPEFWQPITVFGAIWFAATLFATATGRSEAVAQVTATGKPACEVRRG